MTATDRRPLVAHIIHHLVTGGLENGLVNLINQLPESRYRHAVICMKDYSDFRLRIRRTDVPVYAMRKRSGHDWRTQIALFKLFRELRPAIVHGRNLSALDSLLPAVLAGVRVRIHGEHGRDERDPIGIDRRLIWVRRLHSPLVTHYVALNGDLERYLTAHVGVAATRITRIYNGVDLARFKPDPAAGRALFPVPFRDRACFVVGTVGRMQSVKDQVNLARAFLQLVRNDAEARRRARLVIIGDGPLRSEVEQILREGGVDSLAWLAGDRSDVPQLLAGFDLFVLPSRAEGVSNTILEAMATGLPVVATRVGGNPELVEDEATGRLVPAADSAALAAGVLGYLREPELARVHGQAGRARVERQFSLERMVADYDRLYAHFLAQLSPTRTGLQAT